MDDPDQPARARRRIHDRAGSPNTPRRGPAAEQAIRHRRDVLAGEVPADDQRRARRVQAAHPRAPQGLGVEPLHGVGGPAGRPVVRRRRRVDRADQGFLDASARVGLGLEQVVQALVAKTVHLDDRERRVQEELGEEFHRLREPVGRHVQPGGHRVPAGLGMERGPQPFGRLDQGDGVVALGALGQGPCGQHGRSRLVRRLVDGARRQDQRGRHERAAGQVRDEDPQARREPVLVDRGELIRTRRTRHGSLGDDWPVAKRLAVPAHAASSRASPSSRASASAAGPSGRYVSTTRLSTRKTSVAAARMSSAVTAR